jgi:hypothetical protein
MNYKEKKSHADESKYEEETEQDNMFLTGTGDTKEKTRKIRSSKSFTNYEYFKQ